MRCQSCGADIPPQWVAAINSNVCPGCSGPIMDEKQKGLLDELAEAMARMPNDPQGLAGWLLTNYRFQKIGSGEPVEKFHRKGGAGGPIDESNLRIDPDYDRFLSKTGSANKVRETIAKIAQSKNSKMAQFAAEVVGVEDPYGDSVGEPSKPQSLEEVDAEMDREDIETMKLFHNAGIDPFKASGAGGIMQAKASRAPAQSSSADVNDLIAYARQLNEDELLPGEREIAKTAKGAAVLEKERFKRIKAQEALSGSGPIRRAD